MKWWKRAGDMGRKVTPATWLRRWCAQCDRSWERTETRWRQCGELATDIGQQPKFVLPHRGVNGGSGTSLKNQIEWSFHRHLRALEPCVLEDCEQLSRAGLRSQ